MRSHTTVALIVAVFIAGNAQAIDFMPGLWDVSMITESPMGGSNSKNEQHCVDANNKFDPISEMAADPNCTVSDRKDSSTAMSWSMSCKHGPSVMTGSGNFVSKGRNASGEMIMQASFGQQVFKMKNSWVAKHIGPCKSKD